MRQLRGQPSGLGYTLAEMLVVLVVMGIAAALVIPSLGDAGVLRVQSAVRAVVADLTFAQTDALAYQQRRAVLFDLELNSYTVAEVTIVGEGDVEYLPLYLPDGPNQQHIITLNEAGFDGARLVAADFDGEPILIFDEIGGPVATGDSDTAGEGGSVYIQGNDRIFKISVAPYTGQVTVEEVDELPGEGG